MSDKLRFLRLFTRTSNDAVKTYAKSLIIKYPQLVEFVGTIDRDKSGKMVPTLHSKVVEFCVGYFNKFDAFPTKDVVLSEFSSVTNASVVETKALVDIVESVYKIELGLEDAQTAFKVVLNTYKKNLAVSTLSQLVDEDDSDVLLAQAISALSTIQNSYTRNNEKPIVSLSEFLTKKLSEVEENESFSKPCAKYGYKSMDVVVGGFYPGEIVMVAGPPSSGKSFILQNTFCENLEAGIEVVYATNEVSEDQFWSRIVSRYTQIPLDKLRHNALTDEEIEIFFSTVDTLREKFKSKGAFINFAGAKSTSALKAAIEAHYPNEKPKLILLDHPQLMRENLGKNTQDWANAAEVMSGLKQMALEWGCAFFCPVHFNREGSSGEARVEHVKYQTFIEKADTIYVVRMSEDMPYRPPTEPGEYAGTPGVLEVTTGRARSAATGQRFSLAIDFSKATVSDVEEVFGRGASIFSNRNRDSGLDEELNNL